MKRKYIAAQLGARMHYAVPRIMHENNILEKFYTDISIDKSWARILRCAPDSVLPNIMRRLKSRRLPSPLIKETKTYPMLGICYALSNKYKTKQEQCENHLRAGDLLNNAIIKDGLGKANSVFTYNTAGLNLMRYAKRNGLFCVMEQTIAPKSIEIELMKEISSQFPQWASENHEIVKEDRMIERENSEWEIADKILCGSEFVKDSLKLVGVPSEKCITVPYGVPDKFMWKEPSYKSQRKLRVLVVGEVGLRKGSPLVLNVAKKLKDKIDVCMVGPLSIGDKCKGYLEKNVTLTGTIPRNKMIEYFNWGDVFFLPSICEGSATVIYEALCMGLPVVCTKNCGSIVQNNYDGFVIENMDENRMVEALELLADDDQALYRMALNTKISSLQAGLSAYSARLLNALS